MLDVFMLFLGIGFFAAAVAYASMLVLGIGFFALSVAYALACDRL